MTSVHVQFRQIEYHDRYGNPDFRWNIHPSKWLCAAALYILMWGPCKDIFSLTFFQYAMYLVKLVNIAGSLPETVGGRFSFLKKVFTDGYVSSGQTYVPSIIASTCGTSSKALISEYNWGSSSNRKATEVWWYFFTFAEIINFSSGVLSVISRILPSVCFLVTKVVPDFLNLPSMYLICMDKLRYSSCRCILCTCVAARLLPGYSSALSILVQYFMLRASTWFFDDLITGMRIKALLW